MTCKIDSLPTTTLDKVLYYLDHKSIEEKLSPLSQKVRDFSSDKIRPFYRENEGGEPHPALVDLRLKQGHFKVKSFTAHVPWHTGGPIRERLTLSANIRNPDRLVIFVNDKTRFRGRLTNQIDLNAQTFDDTDDHEGPMPEERKPWHKHFNIRRPYPVSYQFNGTTVSQTGETTLSVGGTPLQIKGSTLKDYALTRGGSLIAQTDVSLQVYDIATHSLKAEYNCHLGDHLSFSLDGMRLVGLKFAKYQAKISVIDFMQNEFETQKKISKFQRVLNILQALFKRTIQHLDFNSDSLFALAHLTLQVMVQTITSLTGLVIYKLAMSSFGYGLWCGFGYALMIGAACIATAIALIITAIALVTLAQQAYYLRQCRMF